MQPADRRLSLMLFEEVDLVFEGTTAFEPDTHVMQGRLLRGLLFQFHSPPPPKLTLPFSQSQPPAEDAGFSKAIRDLVQGAKWPIVLTANTMPQWLVGPRYSIVEMSRPAPPQLATLLAAIWAGTLSSCLYQLCGKHSSHTDCHTTTTPYPSPCFLLHSPSVKQPRVSPRCPHRASWTSPWPRGGTCVAPS